MGCVVWRDVFDRVEVVRYVGYDAARGRALDRELDRVGLQGFAQNRWVVRSPFTARLAQSGVRPARGMGAFSELVSGLYAAVRTSCELGARRLLVLEDDSRFVDDMSLLDRAFACIPDDFSVLRLSWMVPTWDARSRSVVSAACGSGAWTRMERDIVKDTGAVAFSRDGMEHFRREVEESLAPGGSLGYCDSFRYYDAAGGHMYIATPLLVIQQEYPEKMCRKRNYLAHYSPFVASCGYGGEP